MTNVEEALELQKTENLIEADKKHFLKVVNKQLKEIRRRKVELIKIKKLSIWIDKKYNL